MVAANTRQTVPNTFPATEQLLVEGGDARIALGANGLNKYGCSPLPDPGLVALGSSTASGISEAGFAAADRLRNKLALATNTESGTAIYKRELGRVRQELLRLCGLDNSCGVEAIFAASGTDAHLIAARLAGGSEAMPALAIMVEAAESGSGVPAALAGRGFNSRAAPGNASIEDSPIRDGAWEIEVASVAIRLADGAPRLATDIDAEFTDLAHNALAQGRRVLLVLADVSKTGMIAPSPACALNLLCGSPDRVEVLVDACQFRIAPETLGAYLERGFMVALTGSKFVSGPPFSGALFIPAQVANRFRSRPFPAMLSAYTSAADWPEDWDTTTLPADAVNFGLLLRWEAALGELRAFRAVPEAAIEAFLQKFAHAVEDRLKSVPVFEPLPTPELERRPLAVTTSRDRIQTIFPFLLLHPGTRLPLSLEQTKQVYRLLQLDLGRDNEYNIGNIGSLRCQLGQPVLCGVRNGVPISALRLCVSARMVVEAITQGEGNAAAVIEKALAALDKTSLLILSVRLADNR